MADSDKKNRTESRTPEYKDAEVRRENAEAEKALAEAHKLNLEAEKVLKEMSGIDIDNRIKELQCAIVKATGDTQLLAADQAAEMRQRQKAGDYYHQVYWFKKQVEAGAVEDCIEELTEWHRLKPGCDIEIIFDSPGGSVISGMVLFDFIRWLQHEGHKVNTVCAGYAASMAGILLQAGTRRIMYRESYILIHEISSIMGGKIGDIEDEYKWLLKVLERVVNIFVDRSGGKLTKEEFVKNWTRKDWWIDSDEALRLGLVDEVR